MTPWWFALLPSSWHDWVKEFRFTPGHAPLSSYQACGLLVSGYLLTLALIKFVIGKTRPLELKKMNIVHNALLSVASGALLLALGSEIFQLVQQHGLWQVFCDPDVVFWQGPHYFLYFVNYLFKVWEFGDTFLLALRGRDTSFLHVYHHASVLVLTWSMMRHQICMQWVPILLNLSIHLVMYAYFALHGAGYLHQWRYKHLLTRAQILQFLATLVLGVPLLLSRVLGELVGLPGFPLCHGSYEGSVVGLAVFASYWLIFEQFYSRRYTAKAAKKTAAPTPAPRKMPAKKLA